MYSAHALILCSVASSTTCWPLASLWSGWCWAPGCLCWADWSCSSSCGAESSTSSVRAATRTARTCGSPTCSSLRSPCSWTETSARPQTRDSAAGRDGGGKCRLWITRLHRWLARLNNEWRCFTVKTKQTEQNPQQNCLIIGKWIIKGAEIYWPRCPY